LEKSEILNFSRSKLQFFKFQKNIYIKTVAIQQQ